MNTSSQPRLLPWIVGGMTICLALLAATLLLLGRTASAIDWAESTRLMQGIGSASR